MAMNSKQTAFLKAMLEESTITKAAAAAGINRKTAYRYLQSPDFQQELNRRRSEAISDTVRYLQGKLALCNETLIAIIENPDTGNQIKINACNSVYANCKAMTEKAEIIARLEQIEKLIGSEGNED